VGGGEPGGKKKMTKKRSLRKKKKKQTEEGKKRKGKIKKKGMRMKQGWEEKPWSVSEGGRHGKTGDRAHAERKKPLRKRTQKQPVS